MQGVVERAKHDFRGHDTSNRLKEFNSEKMDSVVRGTGGGVVGSVDECIFSSFHLSSLVLIIFNVIYPYNSISLYLYIPISPYLCIWLWLRLVLFMSCID